MIQLKILDIQAPNALNYKMMKAEKILLLILIIIFQNGFAQERIKYIILDASVQNNIKFNHIKCADERYKVELFNVFYQNNSNRLTLITALPDPNSKKPIWKEVMLDSLNKKIITIDTLSKQFDKMLSSFVSSAGQKSGHSFKNDYLKPIIKIDNKYYTPISPTLMENFTISQKRDDNVNLPEIFPNLNQFFEINLDSSIFPLAKFEDIFIKKLGHPSFNSSYDTFDRFNIHYVYNKDILIRDNDIYILGKKAYKFWTLGSWTIDGDNKQRGIDRFSYIPELGILSGAYTYIYWNEDHGRIRTLPASELVKLYLSDNQMMPYEINGKNVLK